MSSFKDEWDTAKKISMSEKVGKILKELKATACVHIEQREMIAYVNMILKFMKYMKVKDPDVKEFVGFLNGFVRPALEILGRQRWYRDTITDLGLALSGGSKKGQREDTSDILEKD